MIKTKINKNRKAQEEIVGFSLIIIIVAVILLFFLFFALRNNDTESVQSYEVESFIQASLQYTTQCEDNFGQVSLQELIFECNNERLCADGQEACTVLDAELNGILEESWPVGANRPVKGYDLMIFANNRQILNITEGNITGESKGSVQSFVRNFDSINMSLVVYY